MRHRFEHLGRGYAAFAENTAHVDHMFLYIRQFLVRNFDAEIASGDHYSVGRFKNAFEILYARAVFDFGD